MNNLFENSHYKQELNERGFATVPYIYDARELAEIISAINQADQGKDTFRKSADLFAIRQFLKEVPNVGTLLFTEKLKALINEVAGADYFVVKSIYFDKPANSNWFVSYHQDLTISVDKKIEQENFGPWTVKQNQFAVQPPLEILENIVTIRIHLDETNEDNGALRVIPFSHLKKIYRPETIDWKTEKEIVCPVTAGGVMLMKPLTLHSSGRTITDRKRRVIHMELSNLSLPGGLQWSEQSVLF